jgi:hypothetical protein
MSDPAVETARRETRTTERDASSLPGFWMTVLGGILAVLAPLAGFLGGSTTGAATAERSATLGVWLSVGLVVGGLGVLVAFVGGTRWWRAAQATGR